MTGGAFKAKTGDYKLLTGHCLTRKVHFAIMGKLAVGLFFVQDTREKVRCTFSPNIGGEWKTKNNPAPNALGDGSTILNGSLVPCISFQLSVR